MKLSAKPDFDQARVAWNHYWAREAWKRPLLVAQVPRKNAPPPPGPYDNYFEHVSNHFGNIRQRIDWMLEATQYLAESIPYYDCSLGPDQFAAWMGKGVFHFSKDSKSPNKLVTDPRQSVHLITAKQVVCVF